MLKLDNITKDYILAGNRVPALKGLSLEFRRSEFVSILGPSGCGKTTTMNIVGGLDRYTTGDLVIEGKSTKDYKDKDWDNYRNKRVGFVFQAYNLIPHLTVLGNVEIAMTIAGISPTKRRNQAISALTDVGLQEHLHKKPNQLSGGQMQRVAIARAIVNRPEILLMDEPTGALDSVTSDQIMQLIQSIAKDKLVIMVTHNPELAQQYSTRIIRLKDGELLEDTNPYNSYIEQQSNQDTVPSISKDTSPKQSSSMSFGTAIGLSARNLLTKKKRGIMTSIASAIGIIGIGLVLALTNGLGQYVNMATRASAESAAITITDSAGDKFNLPSGISRVRANDDGIIDVNVTQDPRERILLSSNTDTIELLNGLDSDLYNEFSISTGMVVHAYRPTAMANWNYLSTSNDSIADSIGSLIGFGNSVFKRAPSNMQLVQSQYDIIAGDLPSELQSNQALFVLNNDGTLDDGLLRNLSIDNLISSDNTLSYSNLLGLKYGFAANDQVYHYDQDNDDKGLPPFNNIEIEVRNTPEDQWVEQGGKIVQVVGVLKLKEGRDSGVFGSGIKLSSKLYSDMQVVNANSAITMWMQAQIQRVPSGTFDWSKFDQDGLLPQDFEKFADGYTRPFPNNNTSSSAVGNIYQPGINSLTIGGTSYIVVDTPDYLRLSQLARLGGNTLPFEINIIPNGYSNKNIILDKIAAFNSSRDLGQQIFFVDLVEILASVFNSILNVIGIVLIGFTSVSLIVSAVMIAIITSISVLERTKEIGILRSIGARKKDVTRLFNAENLILGLASGTVGVVCTLIFSFVISSILQAIMGASNLASVTWIHVLILLGVSTIVTLASGYLPSRGAAKKDPVVALRSE
ncbi:MAG: ABC transporter ATP-binding protein/permease [Clostridiales bacterium]|jgi:putative ABC transport system permease protein|nr:ABC transporter ATP-binding protein/permease [Clostridiales bacterium]